MGSISGTACSDLNGQRNTVLQSRERVSHEALPKTNLPFTTLDMDHPSSIIDSVGAVRPV